jgi:hypothetical protein
MAIGPPINVSQQAVHLQIGERTNVAQRTGKLRLASAHSHESAYDFDTLCLQRIDVDRDPLG